MAIAKSCTESGDSVTVGPGVAGAGILRPVQKHKDHCNYKGIESESKYKIE
jgi:hypothetical protein